MEISGHREDEDSSELAIAKESTFLSIKEYFRDNGSFINM